VSVDTERTEAAEFVERFAEAWSRPTGARLAALCHPDVRLVQPMMRETRGNTAGERAFDQLLELVPDLHAEVHRHGVTEDGVLIEFSLIGTLARRPYSWHVVDRITLEDGLVRERISYFDSLPLLLESLKAPRKAPAFLRLMR
jgi:ketosteroid isomerase-like protein